MLLIVYQKNIKMKTMKRRLWLNFKGFGGVRLNRKIGSFLLIFLMTLNGVSISGYQIKSESIAKLEITLVSVQIHNNHELLDAQIYFCFSVNGSYFETAEYKNIADEDIINLDFNLFSSLIKDDDYLTITIVCMESDSTSSDDFVGEYSLVFDPLDIDLWISNYGTFHTFNERNTSLSISSVGKIRAALASS